MTHKVKFYTDEQVPSAIVKGLRLRGVDVVSAKEAGKLGATDEDHIAFAMEKKRVIFTQDVDFLRLHAKKCKPRWNCPCSPADANWRSNSWANAYILSS